MSPESAYLAVLCAWAGVGACGLRLAQPTNTHNSDNASPCVGLSRKQPLHQLPVYLGCALCCCWLLLLGRAATAQRVGQCKAIKQTVYLPVPAMGLSLAGNSHHTKSLHILAALRAWACGLSASLATTWQSNKVNQSSNSCQDGQGQGK